VGAGVGSGLGEVCAGECEREVSGSAFEVGGDALCGAVAAGFELAGVDGADGSGVSVGLRFVYDGCSPPWAVLVDSGGGAGVGVDGYPGECDCDVAGGAVGQLGVS
jgi:hypothetical protein